ncbi:MAG: glycosyltransferase [Cyclobacteriaceae bacterium]|nr:glycosyltransferase [Cyclobacteriaceae bacterium]
MLEILFCVFVASAGIQFLFYTLVLIALSVYKKPDQNSQEIPGVSIVISAKNELENLKKLIPLLLKQQFNSYEIILVDDKSTDETYDYVIELDQNEPMFKLVRIDSTPDHINNKKYALTLGIRAAKFDHVLLTDADCFPESEFWLKEMSLGFTSDKKKFVIGYSQYFKAKGLLNIFIKYETMFTAIQYFGIGLLGNPYMGVGRNIAYRKSFFLDNNGFGKYKNVVGGDDDLLVNRYAKRKNTSFMLSPDSTIYSNPKTKFSEFILQKTRHLSVGKYYRRTDKLLLGLLSMSKIIFWISFIAAIMSVFQTYFVLGGFFLVMASLLAALLVLKKKTGDNSNIWMLPFLDFIFIFYYISTGLKVLFTKKVRWK